MILLQYLIMLNLIFLTPLLTIFAQICQERRIQAVCSHHPFVLPLLRVWQDDRKLYLALPFCNKGQVKNIPKNMLGYANKKFKDSFISWEIRVRRIHNTSFSSWLMNGPNELECLPLSNLSSLMYYKIVAY